MIVIAGLAKTIKCTVRKSILISVYFCWSHDYEGAVVLETGHCLDYSLRTVWSQIVFYQCVNMNSPLFNHSPHKLYRKGIIKTTAFNILLLKAWLTMKCIDLKVFCSENAVTVLVRANSFCTSAHSARISALPQGLCRWTDFPDWFPHTWAASQTLSFYNDWLKIKHNFASPSCSDNTMWKSILLFA